MIPNYKKAEVNKALKGIIAEYQDSYNILRQKSEDKYKTTLQPGAIFHQQNGFYYDEDRQAFQEVCNKLSAKAHGLIDDLAAEVIKQNTTAPTTEAANVVAIINARKEVSADEIDQLMTRYGHDCPMVYKALYEKANSLGYRDFKQHPLVEEAENLAALSKVIDRTFDARTAENSMVASTAAFNVTTDAAFPTGE